MPAIDSIQTGSVTIQAADGTAPTVTITAVVLARSIVYYTTRNADTSAGRVKRHVFKAELTATTTITLTRSESGDATDVILEWVVIEYSSGTLTSLQTGTVDCDADPEDVTITAVTLAGAVPLHFASTNQNTMPDLALAEFTSTTNLRFNFNTAPVSGNWFVAWQVIEFDTTDVDVQSGTITLDADPGAEGSDTATINAVTLTQTFISHGGLFAGDTGVSRNRATLKQTSTTLVEAERSLDGSTLIMGVSFFSVEATDGMAVESGEVNITDTNTSGTASFTAQTDSKSAIWEAFTAENARTDSTQTPDDNFATTVLDADEAGVTITRTGSTDDLWIMFFAVDWSVTPALAITITVVSSALSTGGTGTTSFTKAGIGAPKAWRILVSFDEIDDTGVQVESRMSIGFGDGTNNFCISHQDEDASAKVDCDAIKSNTKSFIIMNAAGIVIIEGTSAAITDGVQLTNTTNTDGDAPFVTVVMYSGDNLNASLVRTTIASAQNGTATIAHSGFTDGNDKLIFFIGTDIGAEDSANSGINNSFGVCHATGNDAGGWTFVHRSIGWASDHNNTEGSPHSEICTDRVLNIITETGTVDWGLEVTDLDHSPAQWTVTTRDAGSGAGMEVYSLAIDLDDRKAKVGSVDSPTGSTFSISGMGFKPQYNGMMLTDTDTESVARAAIETADVQAGVLGISSNTGSGEETCHSWYNAENTVTTDTANLFRSRVIDLRDDDTSQTLQDHSHSSFDSDGVTHTVNSEDEDVAKKWGFWAIEEAAVAVPLPTEFLVKLFDPTQLRM